MLRRIGDAVVGWLCFAFGLGTWEERERQVRRAERRPRVRRQPCPRCGAALDGIDYDHVDGVVAGRRQVVAVWKTYRPCGCLVHVDLRPDGQR